MEPYLGEMRWVAFVGTPTGWMECAGQLLAIKDHSSLYAVIGTTYGGDGVNNFALPNMLHRVLVSGESHDDLGQTGGAETHTLTADEMPEHRHAMFVSSAPATTAAPAGKVLGSAALYSTDPMMDIRMVTSETGAGERHYNMQPYIALRCLIAVHGVFPPRF